MAQLKEFGLPVYAGRAYLALLELGVAEARTVSERASIPSAKVYGALEHLKKRGLADVSPGKPRKYAPVPMSAFLERRLRDQEEQASELRTRMSEIVDLFPMSAGVEPSARPQTVTVEGRRNIMQHLREACGLAERVVYAMLSPSLRRDLAVRRLFEEAAKRGVEVRLIEDDPEPRVPLVTLSHAALGFAPATLIATFDGGTALLARFREGPRKEGQRSAAIFTTDAGFVHPLERLLVLRRELAESDTAAARHTRVDTATFERLLRQHQAAAKPRQACALLHVAHAADLEKDHLWRAVIAASDTRILLSPHVPGPADPAILASLPPGAQVKFLPRASAVAFAIMDGRRAFFVSPTRQGRDRAEEALYAVTADDAIVRIFEAQFEATWAIAVPLQRAR